MRVITGSARGRNLAAPDGLHTRPTSDMTKGAVFSILQMSIENSDFLDLFAGSGQMGVEALSRGAKSAVFVDAREDACRLIRENLKRTKLESQGKAVRSDYLDYLKRTKEKFDIILLDPPYAEVFLENALKCITEIDILQSGGIIVAERPVEKELPFEFEGYTRSRDYKYGKTLLTIYRKD